MPKIPKPFPFDLLRTKGLPEPVGPLIDEVAHLSMVPPLPWGHWLYARVLEEQCATVPGEILEAGVARGGMSIFLGLRCAQLGLDKRVFAVDSFEGLPAPDDARDNMYYSCGAYAPEEGATAALAAFWSEAAWRGLGKTVVPVPGPFHDVLPSLEPGAELSFVHIDADLYASVACALEHLWDRVPNDGVVAIDEFFHPSQGALRATGEFFGLRRQVPVYHVVFPYSVFVVKGEVTTSSRSVDGNVYSFDWLRDDNEFLSALEASLENSAPDSRARENCQLLLRTITGPRRPSADIYDYWRALEQFWEWVDVRPETPETTAPTRRAVHGPQH